MTWNYRVLKKSFPEEDVFQIHEVYYNEAGEPRSWSVDPMEPHGSTLSDLEAVLALMKHALSKPVLEVYLENGVERLHETR